MNIDDDDLFGQPEHGARGAARGGAVPASDEQSSAHMHPQTLLESDTPQVVNVHVLPDTGSGPRTILMVTPVP